MTDRIIGMPASRGFASLGIRITYSHHALEESEERLFPKSRHRSARIRKKLIKRLGGEFRKVPCMWRLPDGSIVAHPAFEARLRAAMRS